MNRNVKLSDNTVVPAIGQGTWYLGEQRSKEAEEKEALLCGIENGSFLLDTAEMYGSGKAEELIGKTIKGLDRSKLFLVSKVYPHNAGRKHIFKSCEDSLRRMGTDHMDLYLLHWRGSIPLSETVSCMEELKKEGKILRWGVSNFDTDDMKELLSIPGGRNCFVNQVLYHVASRGIEYDLLPYMRANNITLMAYCPLAQGGDLRGGLFESPVLKQIAKDHNADVAQVLLSFVIRDGHTIAIPRSGKKAHTLDNLGADKLILTKEELSMIDKAFPAPTHKTYLDIV